MPHESTPPAQLPRTLGHSRFVRDAVPLLASLAAHAIAAVLVLTAASVAIEPSDLGRTEQEQSEPAQSRLYDAAPGGVPNAGLNETPFRPASQERPVEVFRAIAVAEHFCPLVDPANILGGPPSGDPLPALANLGLCQQWNSPRLGTGQGGPDGPGAGDAGPPAAFGFPGGGATAAQPKPYGPIVCCGGNARRIVFLCDVSASMLNRAAALKYELRKAIEGLKPIQSFNVIFFQGGSCLALDLNGVVPATASNKCRAYALLEGVTAGGTTDSLPAFELAFRQQPHLIYLLSDGTLPDGRAVLDRIRILNKDRKTKVKVNAIAFIGTREELELGAAFERIASESGGKFSALVESEEQNDP